MLLYALLEAESRRAVATVGCGGCNTPQASSLSAKLLRIKVLSAIFRKSILSQEDDS